MVTRTQHHILEFIKNYISEKGYSPSLIEIAHGIGIRSKSLISRYVHALHDAGLIHFNDKGYRRIRVTDKPTTNNFMPLLGKIAAGKPIEAISHDENLELTEILLGANRYALQVKGDSMIDEGILDGDIVICEKRDAADEGEIVVALIDNQEATLKQISFTKDGKVALIPANANLHTMTYPATRVQIQGVLVGLLRLPQPSPRRKKKHAAMR